MAEEKRSISISYKADLKDLISKLKQMPNVTEAEAKKMVGALDKQLKQAEKAAKKSAEASKKASQNAAKAARRGVKDFDDMADAARRAEERLENVGEASGDIDRGFSSMGLALRGVNPQLAEAADGLADAFAVTEGLTMSFAALNPLVIAGAGVVAGLTLAYTVYTDKVEQARIRSEEIKEEIIKINESIKEQKVIIESMNTTFGNMTSKVNESSLQLSVMRGEISKLDAATMKATLTAENFRRENEETLKNQKQALETSVQSRKDEIQLMNIQIRTLKDQRKIEQSLTERIAGSPEKFKAMSFEEEQLRKKTEILNEQLKLDQDRIEELKGQENLIAKQAKQLESNLVEIAKLESKAATQTERRADAAERALTAEELNNEALKEAFSLADDLLKGKSLEEKMDKAMAMAFLDDEGKKRLAQRERVEEQIKAIEDLGLATGREAEAELAAIALRREAEEDLNDELLENEEKLQEKRKEGARANLDAIFELGDTLAALADARINSDKIDVEAQKEKQEQVAQMGEIERSAYEQKQKQLRALFRFEKGMALAQVAMGTAEAIMAAQKLPIPFNAIQSGLAIATGVAQAGVVMSQQMPSFHMGGMAPDEATARVLRGEAILDRSTVRRIGGEQGVRNLQQGGSSSTNTVVIQPFKHFGRFAKDLGISKAQPVGIRGY